MIFWGPHLERQKKGWRNRTASVRFQKAFQEKALTAVRIRNAKPGKYADGNGLYLVVDESGAKRTLRTVIRGKRHELGLGGSAGLPCRGAGRGHQVE